MTEADGVRTEIDGAESHLDEIINRVSAVSHLVEEMEAKLLALNLDAGMNTFTGIAMLETIRNSAEFIMNQSFVFRNEIRNYKDRL